MLRALVAEGPNDLFIAEDSHQRIYGSPIVLSRFGIKISGRARGSPDYRTTAQNLQFAVGVLAGADYPTWNRTMRRPSTTVPRATVRHPNSLPAKARPPNWKPSPPESSRGSRKAVEPESIAVLTRNQDDRDRFVRGLGRGTWRRPGPRQERRLARGIQLVLTMHRAKGMEFSQVIPVGEPTTSMSRRPRHCGMSPTRSGPRRCCGTVTAVRRQQSGAGRARGHVERKADGVVGIRRIGSIEMGQ